MGVVLSTVFQLAHTVPDAEFHAALSGEQRMPTGFAEHQVRATVDFAPSNRLLGGYVGGLNFQIEHHLFPDVCHVHYRALAGIAREGAPGLPAATAPRRRYTRPAGWKPGLARREPTRHGGPQRVHRVTFVPRRAAVRRR